jgi:hypothetical protein
MVKKEEENTKVRKMFCGSPQHNQFFHQRYLLLGWPSFLTPYNLLDHFQQQI